MSALAGEDQLRNTVAQLKSIAGVTSPCQDRESILQMRDESRALFQRRNRKKPAELPVVACLSTCCRGNVSRPKLLGKRIQTARCFDDLFPLALTVALIE
jgi:hypothetical protein